MDFGCLRVSYSYFEIYVQYGILLSLASDHRQPRAYDPNSDHSRLFNAFIQSDFEKLRSTVDCPAITPSSRFMEFFFSLAAVL
jgi:hypothetical protein